MPNLPTTPPPTLLETIIRIFGVLILIVGAIVSAFLAYAIGVGGYAVGGRLAKGTWPSTKDETLGILVFWSLAPYAALVITNLTAYGLPFMKSLGYALVQMGTIVIALVGILVGVVTAVRAIKSVAGIEKKEKEETKKENDESGAEIEVPLMEGEPKGGE